MSNESGVASGRPWWPAAAETTGSVVAVLSAAAIFVNFVGAHLSFFGQQAVIDDDAVRTYWALVAVLVVAVASSFVGACWRRAGWAWLWHVLVVLVGTGTAVAFSVTMAGPVQDDPPARSPSPSGPGAPGCHSGGDSSGCPGG